MAADIDECRRRLVDEAGDGILIADADGSIRFSNPGAARIFGFTSEEALGQSLDIIIPAALRARHWHGYAESIRTGQTRYGAGDLLAVPALRRDIRASPSNSPSSHFATPRGRITAIGAVVRDVTRRFEELLELRKALGERKA